MGVSTITRTMIIIIVTIINCIGRSELIFLSNSFQAQEVMVNIFIHCMPKPWPTHRHMPHRNKAIK